MSINLESEGIIEVIAQHLKIKQTIETFDNLTQNMSLEERQCC